MLVSRSRANFYLPHGPFSHFGPFLLSTRNLRLGMSPCSMLEPQRLRVAHGARGSASTNRPKQRKINLPRPLARPVFACLIKVERSSPTKPSAFHYASWLGLCCFSRFGGGFWELCLRRRVWTKHENSNFILLLGGKSAQQGLCSFSFRGRCYS